MPINRWNVALKPGGHYWINQATRVADGTIKGYSIACTYVKLEPADDYSRAYGRSATLALGHVSLKEARATLADPDEAIIAPIDDVSDKQLFPSTDERAIKG